MRKTRLSENSKVTFDIEMLSIHKEDISDKDVLANLNLDEDTKDLFQTMVTNVGASSHMRCILNK